MPSGTGPPAPPPPPTPGTPTFRQWFFDNWQSLTVIGGAWATILVLLGVIYSSVTSSISDLRTNVSDLSKEFNHADASANQVMNAIKDASEAVKLWRETHDQLIGTAIPEINKHTGQLDTIQGTLGTMQGTLSGISTTLGSLREQQNGMEIDLTHLQGSFNNLQQELRRSPAPPRDQLR